MQQENRVENKLFSAGSAPYSSTSAVGTDAFVRPPERSSAASVSQYATGRMKSKYLGGDCMIVGEKAYLLFPVLLLLTLQLNTYATAADDALARRG